MFNREQTYRPSLLSLPPEIRLNIYKHLLPTVAQRPDFHGLRRTCRLIQEEFDHEALKTIRREYALRKSALAEQGVIMLSSLADTLNTSTLTIEIPQVLLNPMTRFDSELIPWNWAWITKVVFTFNADCVHAHLGYRDLWDDICGEMDALIQRSTVRRCVFMGVEQLSRRTTITTVALTWYNTPAFVVFSGPGPKWQRVCSAVCQLYLFYRRWEFQAGFDEADTLRELRWRRRSAWDLAVGGLLCLASFFILAFGSFIMGLVLYSLFLIVVFFVLGIYHLS